MKKSRHIRGIKNRLLSTALVLSMSLEMLPVSTVYASEQSGKDMNLWSEEYSWDDSSLWTNTEAASTQETDSLFTDGEEDSLFTSEDGEDSLFGDGEDTDSLFGNEEDTDAVEETADGDVTLTAETDNVAVTVTGSADALAGVEEVSVTDITEEKASGYKDYLNSLDDGYTYAVPAVYDITLLDAEGNEQEPEGDVTVSLSGYVVKASIRSRNELRIYHDELSAMDEGISAFSMFGLSALSMDDEEPVDLTQMEASVEGMDTVTFTAGSFSPYALVLAGNDTQKEFSFGDKTYFEMDKYLQKTGEMNGQDTYDIYLEQAYYDGSDTVVTNYAPARSDIMLALDQSSSVAGYTDDYNEAVAKLLRTIASTNRDREAKALAGEYNDIDPADVQTDAGMLEAMKDHYMYVAGIVGYNNHLYVRHTAYNNPTLIRSEAEADAIAAKCHIKNDINEYIASGGEADTDQQDFTRTDLATEQLHTWAKAGNWTYTYEMDGKSYDWSSLCCILITDGAPYGESKTPTWPYPETSYPGTAISSYSTNRALQFAHELKRKYGSLNFGVYVPFRNMDDPSVLKAFESFDIDDLVFRTDGDVITLGFLSLWSSDYPINGQFKTTGGSTGKLTGEFDVYSKDEHGYAKNGFGKYIYADRSYPDLINYINSLVSRIDTEAWNAVNSRGYFGKGTTMQDEITDPFDNFGSSSVSVYAVPRIPANLGADGVPTDMDEETGMVSSFRWGEHRVTEEGGIDPYEWIDITEDVVVDLKGSMFTVSGYDFEYNAVTDYDKDLVRYVDGDNRSNGTAYKAGDYGYKLVVVIPICAKFSFGGNSIKTNNSDVSGVIPSTPSGDNPNPPWEENTKINPSGDKFVGKYPDPEVDLKVSYRLAKDDAIIYAPQTEELHDLLTDEALNQIWYADSAYYSLKSVRDACKNALDAANDRYRELQDMMQKGTGEVTATDLMEAEQEIIQATDDLYNANQNLSNAVAYIPDGLNNAFVDIDYTFSDPDGNVLATMHVPHGFAYIRDADGNANIDWTMNTAGQTLNENGNPIITKNGEYTIRATVTPVDTVKSDDWHVHVENDDDAVKEQYPDSSTEYSPTGSTAAGTQSALTVEEHPTAHIFTLEITAADSRRDTGQAIDFDEGPGAIRDMVERGTNIHITDYRWVCADGTQSKTEDEPGVVQLQQIGSDAMVETKIVEQAYTDSLVKNVANVVTITAGTGEFVPVNAIVSRMVGNLNKSVSTEEQVHQTTVVMGDDDHRYGDMSSVTWIHNCDIITQWNCNDPDQEFDRAGRTYNDTDEAGHAGKVHYLMHVYDNPAPDISKSTTTPAITVGSDIDWTVSVSNTDIEKNESMLPSEFSMVDVLPWTGDGRIDPNYGADRKDGSRFGGTLYYKKMVVDYSNAASGADNMSVYYTTDTAVRTAEDGQLTGKVEGITWTKADSYSVSGTSTGYSIPENAVAVRLDTVLGWNEGMSVNLVANVTDTSQQKPGDYYHNSAWIAQNKGTINQSNVVSTQVTNLYIAGTIWEDTDSDGLKMTTEPVVPDVRVTLYRRYNSMNNSRIVRTINGIDLVEAYNDDGDKFMPQMTDSSGSYMFDNVPKDTYYVVADLIPDKYVMTRQRAGAGDAYNSLIDSEAETDMINSGAELEKTAWIKAINVANEPAGNQNFGLSCIVGSVHVGKTVNEIYYPSAMTEEEREDYRINATFKLRNVDTGKEYRRTVYMKEDNIHTRNGRPQVWGDFEELPLGTYELTEQFDPNYHLANVQYTSGNVSYDRNTGRATVRITANEPDIEFWMENVARPDPPAGDENGVANPIKIRKPISLDVIYSGADPISNHAIYEYSFVRSDFSHDRLAADGSGEHGDIIVTYDDGTQIKLSDGSLDFDLLTFNPSKLDSSMNSGSRRTTVMVYYSERGHVVHDSFNVRVDLKPYFKFTANFRANGSTFNNGDTTNTVGFVYNDQLGQNEVTSGTYKDVGNGGLKELSGFWQSGWNTQADGQGYQYGYGSDALSALDELGRNKTLTTVDLYANWRTTVTFDANGGTLAGGTSSWETDAYGGTTASTTFSRGQSIATSLVGVMDNSEFLFWNTKPDGTGTNLSDYNSSGGCRGAVTFYAVYFKSVYFANARVQTFTAPFSGWYSVEMTGCWGSNGGDRGAKCAPGTHVMAEVHFRKGETVGVMIGTGGIGGRHPNTSWNGGGISQGGDAITGAGGRTDIRTTYGTPGSSDWQTGYTTDILTAGGGGGAKKSTNAQAGIGFDQDASTLLPLGTGTQFGGGGGHKNGKSMKGGSSYYDPDPNRVRNAYVDVPGAVKTWGAFYDYYDRGVRFSLIEKD